MRVGSEGLLEQEIGLSERETTSGQWHHKSPCIYALSVRTGNKGKVEDHRLLGLNIGPGSDCILLQGRNGDYEAIRDPLKASKSRIEYSSEKKRRERRGTVNQRESDQ